MRYFLSERNIELHKRYLNDCLSKISILKKSTDNLSDNIKDLRSSKVNKDIKREAYELYFNRDMHELYFKSFVKDPQPSSVVRRCYGTENNFVYELYRFAKGSRGEFIAVYLDRRGNVRFDDARRVLSSGYDPQLAVDLCEHAYFLDYGYDREKYLTNALSGLNLAMLDTKNGKSADVQRTKTDKIKNYLE